MNDADFDRNSDDETPRKQPATGLTLTVFGLLVLWILSIATGTVLFGEAVNWQKTALVVLPMILFLTLWAWLLAHKRSR